MMLQEIIERGQYKFTGNLDMLKRCVSSFKITHVIKSGKISGIEIFEARGKFRFHGETHKVLVSKSWGNEDILFIKYKGKEK